MCKPSLSLVVNRVASLLHFTPMPGVQMGAPGLTQGYIFAEGARTLSW
jgi:hypothetical protein